VGGHRARNPNRPWRYRLGIGGEGLFRIMDEGHRRAHAGDPDEWRTSMPELVELGERQARSTAPKAWRFEGEMHQLADSFEAAGLPDGFLRAAAEVYGRLAQFKDSTDVDPNAVLATLLTASDLDSATPAAAPAGTKKPSDPRPE
jgi:hypothetical protein